MTENTTNENRANKNTANENTTNKIQTNEIRLSWAGATDQGLVRIQNQDSMYANADLFVVADGLGSPGGGEIASNLAVRAMASNAPSTTNDLVAAVHHANTVVHTRSIEQAELAGMGTTLCALAIIETDGKHQFGLVNVGDSRAYRHQDGQIEQLTLDHNRVAEMLRCGMITPIEAESHRERNTLTRAIGVSPTVVVDQWMLDIVSGDRYLLCSDGISSQMPESEISSIMSIHSSAADTASMLVRTALDHGGNDNATALVVDVKFPHNPEPEHGPEPERGPNNPSKHNPVADMGTPADGGNEHPTPSKRAGHGRRRWFQSRPPRG